MCRMHGFVNRRLGMVEGVLEGGLWSLSKVSLPTEPHGRTPQKAEGLSNIGNDAKLLSSHDSA